MTTPYDEMWEKLNLDLPAHEGLLQVHWLVLHLREEAALFTTLQVVEEFLVTQGK